MGTYPNFEAMEKIGTFQSVAEALERFYKRDRLNSLTTTRGALIADGEKQLRENGHAILASKHDNVVGRALWLKPVAEGFEVYASKH